MKFLFALSLFIGSTVGFAAAPPPILWENAQVSQLLTPGLDFLTNVYILTGSQNPSAVATNAPEGSLFLQYGGAFGAYLKQDNGNTTNWALLSVGGAGLTGLGPFDGQARTANGLAISGNNLYAQSADATHPGMLSTGIQTIAGAKTFSGAISASNLSGTNTGDLTLGTANGLSLALQVLSLQAADTTHTGALTSADWNTFNGKQAALTFGAVSTSTTGVSVTNGANSTVGPNVAIDIQNATTAQPGLLTAADWNTFNGKQAALSFGNLTDAGTDGITVTGGAGSVIGAGTSLSQHVADTTHNGYLGSADWNTFNGKQAALTFGSVSTSTTGVTVANGANSTVGPNVTVDIQTATGAQPGLLSAADWTTFNNKQPAGNYITALTGDVAASGPGSVAATIQPLAVTNSKIANSTIDLTAKVTGLLPNANVASIPVPETRYIDFNLGSDVACPASPCGDGSSMRPWHTLNHAYASVTDESVNNPYAFIIAGGNNDPDTGTINAKPNIALYAPYQIQISQPFVVGPGDAPGIGNDVLNYTNITFLFAFSFVKNDASLNTIFVVNTEFNSGPTLKQNGSGWIFLDAFNVTTNNADFKFGDTGALFFNPYFNGTTTFEDATSSAYYQFMGGYLGGQLSITGAPFVYSSGFMIDVPFGATWTNVHSANGDPTIQFDSAGLPPSVTGAFSSVFTSFSQYVGYTPATSGNWNSVPATVKAGLDTLASSGVVKSQAQNLVLASPNGSAGVMTPRLLVAADIPALPYSSSTLTNTHLFVGSAGNIATDVAASGDLTLANTGAFTIANSAVTNAKIANSTIDLTSKVTGILPVANGGTNSAAALNNNRIMQSSGGAVVEAAAITASRALVSDANGIPTQSVTTAAEEAFLSGVTSNVQTQLNSKASSTLTNTHLFVGNGSNVATDVAASGDLTLANTGAFTIANSAVTNAKIANATIDLTSKVTGLLPVANGGTNSSAALNNNRVIQSSGGALVEAAAITASRALVSDANGIPTQSVTTSAEEAFLSGVTSSVQTQLNGKASSTLTNTHLYVGNGSNVATDVAVSGDLSLANTGAFTIANNAVNAAKMSCGVSGGGTVPTCNGAGGINYLSPPTATTLTFEYTGSANTSVANTGSTTLIFANREFDVNSSGGGFVFDSVSTFTAPFSGKFNCNCAARYSSAAYVGGDVLTLDLNKNGSAWSNLAYLQVQNTQNSTYAIKGQDMVPLATSDTVTCSASNSRTAGATTLDGNSSFNYFSCFYVGP